MWDTIRTDRVKNECALNEYRLNRKGSGQSKIIMLRSFGQLERMKFKLKNKYVMEYVTADEEVENWKCYGWMRLTTSSEGEVRILKNIRESRE